MKKSRGRRLALSALSILLALSMLACSGGGQTSDTGGDTDAAGTAKLEETFYEPEIDADADSLPGITIRSADDLAKIGTDSDYPLDGDYFLVIDLDLSGNEWTPIGGAAGQSGMFTGDGVFTGTFDGRGHKITGLTINAANVNYTSYWGLFGSVGSRRANDPAVIKNIVMKDVNIHLASNSDTGVGALAGQVNGYAEIDSISLLSGSVTYNGNGNLGCGGLIGQCRTQRQGNVSNEGIFITNIFSNVSVTSNNGGWDTCGGIIGRIRDSSLGELSDVVLVAPALTEGYAASAIASGDGTANISNNLYYLTDTGVSRDGLGRAVKHEMLLGGGVTLSGVWTVKSGFYPLLTAVMERPDFTIMELAVIEYADGEGQGGVRSNFTLPTSVFGYDIKWTSNDSSVISVSGKNAKVKAPESGTIIVKLTADFGIGTADFVFRVLGRLASGMYFITEYVEADKPIEVGGYEDASSFKWTVDNYADGTTRTETTTEPRLTVTEADSESLITCSVDGQEDISIYYSYLPIIYFDSRTPYTSVGSGDYTDVTMKLCAPSGSEGLYNGSAQIRLRGNSTAGLNKKPFKLKLDKKTNLLGIDNEGKSKHWVLLANARDPSLMRSKLLMDFSGTIGTEPYMCSENVVLIYNGEYCGVYQLTEHIRVSETRVDIFDWEEYAEDAAELIAEKLRSEGTIGVNDVDRVAEEIENQMFTDWSWMKKGTVTYNGKVYRFTSLGLEKLPDQTGGFLLEMDFPSLNDWSLAKTQTAYAQPLYFNTPEPVGWDALSSFYETSLYSYAYNYVQSFEYAVHSDDFFFRNGDTHYYAENWWDKWAERVYLENDYSDPLNDGKHYSELFDMDSLIANFIFCEIAMNWDSMKNSFFVYKDIDGLAKIGPQWDFDWAWGNQTWPLAYGMNTWDPEEWHCRDENFMREQYYQEVQWNCLLVRDPYFLTKVWERWQEIRDNEIEALVGKSGTISTYQKYIRRAALANDSRWAYVDAFGITFDESVSSMEEFISIRMKWIDRQFKSIDTLINSIGVYHASESISAPAVSVGASSTTFTVTVNDSSIKYVNFQINGTTTVEAQVSGGKATVTVNNSSLDASGYNCVVAYARDGAHNYIIDEAHSIYGNYNQVVSNYTSFKLR